MYKKYFKRFFDIIISSVALVLLFPIYILIGLTIKFIDKGKIFYTQERTGKDGKNFYIYKFRTMKDEKETKLGRFLRNTSLDEIPQFLNVLNGDMSIVGPRPWIPSYYNNFDSYQKRRVEERPGIVGLAQVNGRRSLNVFEKINFDIEYIENLSLLLDIKIVLKSVKVLIVKEESENPTDYIANEIEMLKNKKEKAS